MTEPSAPRLTAQLEDALRLVAGPDTAPVSLTVDYAGEEKTDLAVRGWIERATRSLVFAQAEARTAGGVLAGAASGVFRRVNV
ncbi:hotdog family protein [Caulobacter hibisci]|uniref:Uncharacterized protein n=1 Tax=Caulobacter hibisci TaxID=2035993 RepID=A0ABS0SZP6_9CAUL|nr:hypothetical protein [Caulobacter hibisci]MBI1684736.1 hypothetical protein [Caulobacter hibisci]